MERTSMFPLGIFSKKVFHFPVPRGCIGEADDFHVTAWSSEHDLSKRKNMILCLELMLQTWRRWMHWFTLGNNRPLVMPIYSNSFWYLLLSPKAKPESTHVFYYSNFLKRYTNFHNKLLISENSLSYYF